MARGPAGDDRGQPTGKAKPEKMKRPEGMSREAFALLGGSNPVIPTHLLGESFMGQQLNGQSVEQALFCSCSIQPMLPRSNSSRLTAAAAAGRASFLPCS